MEKLKIYCTLDDIWDTRLSLMFHFNLHAGYHALEHGYRTRLCDDFLYTSVGVSEKEWNRAWGQRVKLDLLRRSTRSKLLVFVRDMVIDSDETPRERSNELNLEMVINEFPYRLDDQERKEMEDAIKTLVHPLLKVKYVRRNMDAVSPRWLVDNCTHAVLYDYSNWMYHHQDPKEPGNLTQITILTPRLLPEIPSEEELKEHEEELEKVDIFQVTEQYLSVFMNLRFISVDYFNVP